jgi:hypothetical protein
MKYVSTQDFKQKGDSKFIRKERKGIASKKTLKLWRRVFKIYELVWEVNKLKRHSHEEYPQNPNELTNEDEKKEEKILNNKKKQVNKVF